MNHHIITDTHFGHKKLTDENIRPLGYEKTILKYLDTIKPNDILIHLGDFAFKKIEYWAALYGEHCKGKKWLIRGNHDHQNLGWYYSHGFDMVCDRIFVNIYGKKICFSHEPVRNSVEELFHLNIHGHMHEEHREYPSWYNPRTHFHASIEKDFKPRCLRTIVEQVGSMG